MSVANENNKSALLQQDLETVLALLQPTLDGDDDPRAIHIIRPLAALYHRLNKPEKALPLVERIYNLTAKHFEHPLLPSLYDARQRLAETLQSLNRHEEAAALFQRSLFDFDDDKTACDLFRSLMSLQKYAEAERLAEQYLDRCSQADSDLAFSAKVTWITNLSKLYASQKRFGKAAATYEAIVPLMTAKAEVMLIPFLDVLADYYRSARDEANHNRVRTLRRQLADKHDY